jgi:cytochrome c
MKTIVATVAGFIGATALAAEGIHLPPGDPETGATLFKKCAACHTVGPNAKLSVGPPLNGIIGRPVATYPGYAYSMAMKNAGIVWDEATLARYLRAPQQVLPGTKMSFPGLMSDQEVADVISYLKQFDGTH